jgi:protein-S-isoprenylcysteine O-methyltransferase Ste14
MQKLNFYGAGPKIGRIVLPWLALAIILSLVFKGSFIFFADEKRILFYSGLSLIALGLIMYFSTIPVLLKGIRETRLITGGAFYLCCNPLYTAIILFLIPGSSLMMNSWLVLTTSIVAYIIFRIYIRSEKNELLDVFGEEYEKYRALTPEFFPFPVRKIFQSK